MNGRVVPCCLRTYHWRAVAALGAVEPLCPELKEASFITVGRVAESVVVLLVTAVSFVVDATAADAVESAAGTLIVSGADT